jgi:hypothetical protein
MLLSMLYVLRGRPRNLPALEDQHNLAVRRRRLARHQ